MSGLQASDLALFWAGVIALSIMVYVILDGFDLGVGILHLTARGDEERRLYMNAIGPLWDGNEVWLVTFGGALFAAFPEAYATAFSGFYLPFMLLLFALIFRGVSMEFRSKHGARRWRSAWDAAFCGSSALASLLFGVAVGNMMMGIPIGADRNFSGTLADLLRPYPLAVGALVVALFAMHGSIYLYLKTEGELQRRIRGLMWKTFYVFAVLYVAVSAWTLLAVPTAMRHFEGQPWLWGIAFLNACAVANIPRAIHKGAEWYAFVSSCAVIAALVALFGAALFPNLVVSSLDPKYSLNIYNAASSHKTLGIMRNIAILGMPFVISYTAVIYWVFRGKVKLSPMSY
ncbi:MAG: cytochrome d ubiquinol oxidase subunit II [Planctomycetota bacterium]|nr:cytochrome d ubiquinol oxidase subunit II [Planctomycetota bacterium]